MMGQDKFFSWLTSAVVCSLLLIAGCAPVAKETAKLEVEPEKPMPKAVTAEAVTLALKFTPQDSATYKLTTQAKRSVEFEDPSSDKGTPVGGHNENTIEMTFTQQIQNINDKGNAITKITIEELKYLSIVKDNTILDFDSSREKDQDNPLAKLIGQSYTIEIAPTGKIIKVIDAEQAKTAVKGKASANKAALL